MCPPAHARTRPHTPAQEQAPSRAAPAPWGRWDPYCSLLPQPRVQQKPPRAGPRGPAPAEAQLHPFEQQRRPVSEQGRNPTPSFPSRGHSQDAMTSERSACPGAWRAVSDPGHCSRSPPGPWREMPPAQSAGEEPEEKARASGWTLALPRAPHWPPLCMCPQAVLSQELPRELAAGARPHPLLSSGPARPGQAQDGALLSGVQVTLDQGPPF